MRCPACSVDADCICAVAVVLVVAGAVSHASHTDIGGNFAVLAFGLKPKDVELSLSHFPVPSGEHRQPPKAPAGLVTRSHDAGGGRDSSPSRHDTMIGGGGPIS